MSWYVYIVQCNDGTLYTGISIDVSRRIHQHNNTKKGAKSIRHKRPVVLKYIEHFDTQAEAMRRELEIKRYTRKRKLQLITK